MNHQSLSHPVSHSLMRVGIELLGQLNKCLKTNTNSPFQNQAQYIFKKISLAVLLLTTNFFSISSSAAAVLLLITKKLAFSGAEPPFVTVSSRQGREGRRSAAVSVSFTNNDT